MLKSQQKFFFYFKDFNSCAPHNLQKYTENLPINYNRLMEVTFIDENIKQWASRPITNYFI